MTIDGERQDELAAVPDALAAGLDRSAVKLDELADERQADAETALPLERLVHPREEIEDLRQLSGRDADAVVA